MSPNTRLKIIKFRQQNWSIRKIPQELNVAKSTVCDTWKLFKQTGDVRERNRPGRKRKTDERLNRYLRHQSLLDRRRTAVDISRDINQWRGTRVSVWTVRRRLRELGLKARLAYKKPLVSLKNRKKRLSFAKDHEHWGVEDWKKVLFTDETKVNLGWI